MKGTLTYIFLLNLLIGCNTEPKKNRVIENIDSIDTLSHYNETEKQSYPTDHKGEWLLKSNLFDSLLTFKRIELLDSSVIFGKKFNFEDSALKYEDFNPVPRCGNGMFYMDTSQYEIKDSYITLNFRGGFIAESSFDYSAKYVFIDKGYKHMTLKRIEILKYDRKNFYDEINKNF